MADYAPSFFTQKEMKNIASINLQTLNSRTKYLIAYAIKLISKYGNNTFLIRFT